MSWNLRLFPGIEEGHSARVRCPRKFTMNNILNALFTRIVHSLGVGPSTKQKEIGLCEQAKRASKLFQTIKVIFFYMSILYHILEFPRISWNYFISQQLPGNDQYFPEFGKFPSKWKYCTGWKLAQLLPMILLFSAPTRTQTWCFYIRHDFYEIERKIVIVCYCLFWIESPQSQREFECFLAKRNKCHFWKC